jgi:hypothetical protein
MRKQLICALALAMAAAGCSDDEVVSPGERGSVEVTSDPQGAVVELDGANSGKTTPATFWDLSGRHNIVVRLDRGGIAYGYRTQVDIRGDSLHRIHGPLMFRCESTTCLLASARNRDLGRIRISTQANGALLSRVGQGDGLLWPLGSSNSYASVGMPLIAMVAAPRDTLAMGIYDYDYLAGRPEPTMTTSGARSVFRQSTWIVPPTSVLVTGAPTVRGIEVMEELTADANSDVVYVKLTFRNITNRDSYRAADPLVPNSGLTFSNVYIGFGVDADIGNPDDDFITYEPALDMVYAYDSNFQEQIFSTANAAAPGLVGLRVVQRPTDTNVILNAWPNVFGTVSGDWSGGNINEPAGFGILSGTRSFAPDHEGTHVGFMPGTPGDYRMSVSAGPLTLPPGGEASITIALVMASPVSGEYTSGTAVAPGSPADESRAIRRIAGTLLDRARTAVAP